MKKKLLWGTTCLVIIVFNVLITKKEHTLASGKTMLFRLAPTDPRSLIQGDYMVLRYAIARDISNTQLKGKGYLVVSLDENDVATFLRIYQGERLKANEHLLFYRHRGGLRLGAESFMFQEGDAKIYANARYGELKVAPSGTSILVGLRDDAFAPLSRKY